MKPHDRRRRKRGKERKGRRVAPVVLLDSRRHEKTVLEKVREAWRSGAVIVTEHWEDRLDGLGLSDADIWNVLKHGRLDKSEEPIAPGRHVIRGKSIDGATVTCAVELNGNELTLVTVFEDLASS